MIRITRCNPKRRGEDLRHEVTTSRSTPAFVASPVRPRPSKGVLDVEERMGGLVGRLAPPPFLADWGICPPSGSPVFQAPSQSPPFEPTQRESPATSPTYNKYPAPIQNQVSKRLVLDLPALVPADPPPLPIASWPQGHVPGPRADIEEAILGQGVSPIGKFAPLPPQRASISPPIFSFTIPHAGGETTPPPPKFAIVPHLWVNLIYPTALGRPPLWPRTFRTLFLSKRSPRPTFHAAREKRKAIILKNLSRLARPIAWVQFLWPHLSGSPPCWE